MNINTSNNSSLPVALNGAANTAQRTAMQRQNGGQEKSPLSLDKLDDLVTKRIEQLNTSMTDMAQRLVKGFTGLLLGDAAEGAQISFSEASLASMSRFGATSMSQQDENGRVDAAGFSLQEASMFKGKGTITTADGRSFEFEMEIRYSASIESSAVTQSSNGQQSQGQGQEKVGNQDSYALPDVTHFLGTAADLLDRLRSEPVRMPFQVQQPNQTDTNATPLWGDLAMRLLGLPDGDRYLDLLPQATGDNNKKAGGVDLLA
ncbi:hypothetical protein [Chitinimonas sp. BJB300]|uniref:hypothetical protein n=1 Tax=Chitinimonas sp. BJB300 TaxID=1559339 RepID=UPI000C11BDE2|nr:hypothetical protein [Chitinimonas sp. BJB300]PHV13166.1 hypothetical protein CSQ89_01855 [Chitinimonas sp. BJB300]TSJ87148.1 hypothetical protein FG002_015355 [Chitinimonas sp. BJB300]